MPNLGVGEILVIAVFALLVFGPKRLPEVARSVGKALREFKKATTEFTDEIKSGLDETPKAPDANPAPQVQDPKPGPRV